MSDKSIEEQVDEATARCIQDYEEAHAPRTPTPEEEISQRLNEARFRERIGEQALLLGVRPSAVRHVVRDAQEVFELHDNCLKARRATLSKYSDGNDYKHADFGEHNHGSRHRSRHDYGDRARRRFGDGLEDCDQRDHVFED